MGFKIRMGMAGIGLIMSYFFGFSGLSGVATHLDSTGNILVDIADGIGLVSKGIEALEGWVDPNSQQDETTKPEADTVTSPMDATPPVATPQMVKPPVATPPPPQPVICKKGKCQPYDPAKDKVLQEQLIKAERERILQEIKSGVVTADTGKKLLKKIDEEVEESDDKIPPTVAKRLKNSHQTSTTTTTKYSKSSSKNQGVPSPKPMPTSVDTTPPKHSKLPKHRAEILDPSDPRLVIPSSQGGVTPNAAEATLTPPDSQQPSSLRHGSKRILRSVVNVCQNLNQLLLKVVAKIFPWNRRAKRRLRVGGDVENADDEL